MRTLIMAIIGGLYLASFFLHPSTIHLEQAFCNPSIQHPIGCDSLGRDMLLEFILAIRWSLSIGLTVVVLKLLIAIPLGTIAGLSKRAGFIILLFSDMLLAIPAILPCLLLATVLPQSKLSVLFTIVITGWANPTRYVRSQVVQLQTAQFIESAIAVGASWRQIIFRQILPNLIPGLEPQIFSIFLGAILTEATLSYLGIGGMLNNQSWGMLIAEGRQYIIEYPRVFIIPSLGLSLLLVLLHYGFRQKDVLINAR